MRRSTTPNTISRNGIGPVADMPEGPPMLKVPVDRLAPLNSINNSMTRPVKINANPAANNTSKTILNHFLNLIC